MGDKFGRYNVMIFFCFISAVFILGLWIPVKNAGGIIAFVVIFGFSSGGFISLAPALISQITTDLSQIGTRLGGVFAIQSIGALIGSPIGGAIEAAQDGDYLGLQLFCGFCILVGTFIFMGARFVQSGFSLKAKV